MIAARKLGSFILLSRPHFLLGAALLYGVGATTGGPVAWDRYLLGQAMVTAIQLTTHYANEFFDVASDAVSDRRTWLTGGSGVLVEGRLHPGVALRAAAVTAVVSAALIIWVYLLVPAAAFLGVAALLAGWFYSAPPLRLEGSGVGEVLACVVVSGMVPATAALLQRGAVPPDLWWVASGLAMLQFAMLIAFSLPDVKADREQGKLVLAARIGTVPARIVQAVAVGTGLLTLAAAATVGPLPSELVVLLLPAAVAGVVQVVRAPGVGSDPVGVTSAAATLLLAAAGTLIVMLP